MVIKLHTKSGADHFLEACSREERDHWAEDIASAVNKLGVAGGDPGTDQDDLAGSQLHNVNLRRDAHSAGCASPRGTAGFMVFYGLLLSGSKVLDSMYDVHSGIRMSNHVQQGSTYSNCFSGDAAALPLLGKGDIPNISHLRLGPARLSPAGSAVVDWLVFTQLALTRVEAMTLASALLEEGFLRTIGLKSAEALRTASLGEQFMDDSTALYSFVSAAGQQDAVVQGQVGGLEQQLSPG